MKALRLPVKAAMASKMYLKQVAEHGGQAGVGVVRIVGAAATAAATDEAVINGLIHTRGKESVENFLGLSTGFILCRVSCLFIFCQNQTRFVDFTGYSFCSSQTNRFVYKYFSTVTLPLVTSQNMYTNKRFR